MTRKELMRTDKKIRKHCWRRECWIQFDESKDAFIREDGNEHGTESFHEPDTWEYFIEPKPKRVIELEEWVCVKNPQDYYEHISWVIKGTRHRHDFNWKRTGLTDRREVEA